MFTWRHFFNGNKNVPQILDILALVDELAVFDFKTFSIRLPRVHFSVIGDVFFVCSPVGNFGVCLVAKVVQGHIEKCCYGNEFFYGRKA